MVLIKMNSSSEKYLHGNVMQRSTTDGYLRELESIRNWKETSKGAFLDVGCGPGDVTYEILLPFLPEDFEKIIGWDISEEYINYAKKTYASKDKRISFQVMDIASDLNGNMAHSYDHITSFFCLQWIHNYKKAITNIFNLLKPNGDFLMIVPAEGFYWDAMIKLSESSTWKPFMHDVLQYASSFRSMCDMDLSNILQEVGFKSTVCSMKPLTMKYTKQKFIDFVSGINAFEPRIPQEQRENFYVCLLKEYENAGLVEDTPEGRKYIVTFSILVGYAKTSK